MSSLSAFPLPSLPSRGRLIAVLALLAGVIAAVYGQTAGYPFVRWDDGMLIYENRAVMEMSWASLKHIFTSYDPELYIPLTLFSFQIDFLIGGGEPWVFHVHNLLWHIVVSGLVTWLAYLLLGSRWTALLVGLLFAVHPLNTEAVVWSSARKDLLSTAFLLGATVAYLYFRDRGERRLLFISLGLFLLSLFSKGVVITFPFLLLLIDYVSGRDGWRGALKEKIPFFILAFVFLVIGWYGKTGVIGASSTSAKVVISFLSTLFYLWKFVWPVNLSVLYPYNGDVSLSMPLFYLPLIGVIALIAGAAFAGKWHRIVPFAVAFYLVTLAPTFLNSTKGEGEMYIASDRYVYVPMIGILLLAGYLLLRLARGRDVQRMTVAGGGVIVAFCAVLAFRQARTWSSSEALFRQVITVYPDSSHIAYNNLANLYRQENKFDEAIEQYRKGLAVRPHPRLWSNLASAYRAKGMYAEAQAALDEALKLDPEFPETHFGLGILQRTLGRADAAEASYRRAIELDPRYEEAYTNLGGLLADLGRTDEAIDAYEKALAINPRFPVALFNLGNAYAKKGDGDAAIDAFRRAVGVNGNFVEARINLGVLLSRSGDTDGAVEQFRQVLRINPAHAGARKALQQLGAL